jgi:phage repressor protein C with HTH and peptisase S24 domain
MSSELIDPDFRNRLEQLIGDESPFRWAANAGIPKASFSRIWNEGAPPKADHLRSIARYSGVNLNWLLTGEGSMRPDLVLVGGYDPEHAKTPRTSEPEVEYSQFVFVPVYDVNVEGGPGALNGNDSIVEEVAFRTDWVKEKTLDPKKLAIVRVIGDSMSPTLVSGDMVMLDTRTSKSRENAIYAIEVNGFVRIKRLMPKIDGSIVVSSDNPTYPPEFVSASEADRLRVIGRAVWVGKSL